MNVLFTTTGTVTFIQSCCMHLRVVFSKATCIASSFYMFMQTIHINAVSLNHYLGHPPSCAKCPAVWIGRVACQSAEGSWSSLWLHPPAYAPYWKLYQENKESKMTDLTTKKCNRNINLLKSPVCTGYCSFNAVLAGEPGNTCTLASHAGGQNPNMSLH